ncbi:hypothetical protein SSX86_026323 [Deinandra increscens subsp. villosa]|uniref:Replication protein A 32 kDa subunit n=1 Tax=Deinandra increscens subsp. villosa TaxID=3103831 RepID=A0AAP0CEN1_9ASTR
MTYGSDFDGGAAFSGGGFMPSPPTQTADPSPSAFSKNRDTQTLIPLTAKQINKALLSNDDKVNFIIDGVDVSNVKLVGMVLEKDDRVTNVSFFLDDGTGRIECNRWIQDPVDTKEMNSIMNGMYVRVHGQIKGFQGKKQLVVFGIKPVTEFDEITHHFVECIYVHSYNTKLMKQKASISNQTHTPGSAVKTQAYKTAPSNQFTAHYGVHHGVEGVEKMVLDYLMFPASLAREKGVHQDELVSQLGIPLDRIKAAINFLMEEAAVYDVDDVHYKAAANA